MVDQIMSVDCQAYDIENQAHVEAIVGEIEKRVNSGGAHDLFQLSLVFTGGFAVGGGIKAGATTDECFAWFKERIKGQQVPKPLVQQPHAPQAAAEPVAPAGNEPEPVADSAAASNDAATAESTSEPASESTSDASASASATNSEGGAAEGESSAPAEEPVVTDSSTSDASEQSSSAAGDTAGGAAQE